MTDQERDEVLLDLLAEMEMLRSIVGILCVWSLPDEAVATLIDELDIPLTTPHSRPTNAAADRIADKLAQLRSAKRARGY